jgi:glycosyltransferase involved in cell wall biosynthesis
LLQNKISVNLITGNEEENIRDCLESIKWLDKIIVVDSKSTGKTVEIAKE